VGALRRRFGGSRGERPAAGEEVATADKPPGGLTRRMLGASALLALIIGGAFAVLLLAIGDLRGAERRSRHAQDVLVAANHLERLLLDLETGQRGFVITGQERFLEPWRRARRTFPLRAAALQALVAGEPTAREAAGEIARSERAYIREYSVPLVRAARRGDPSARTVAATEAGRLRVDAMRVQFDDLLNAQRGVDARSQASAESAARRASAAAAAGIAGSVALIALFAAYLTYAIVRPVRRAAAMARRFAGGDLAARMPETGMGEIGTLERAFNVMGSSLERSRDELAALAAEQAALRRVATLVARGAPPAEVFTAVSEEVGRLLSADLTFVARYEGDDAASIVGAWSATGDATALGTRYRDPDPSVSRLVRETGRPARVDSYHDEPGDGPAALGIRAAVGAPITVAGRLWGLVTVASKTREPPPGTEARLGDFTELVATAIANAEAQAELTASRARIVATADETRRRIERDLHDGAQQRLASLALRLRAAQASVPPDLQELATELNRVAAGLNAALEELREFARGIHPAILAEGGLDRALRTLARRSVVPVDVTVRMERRLPDPIEVGAYYVVSEGLANVAKHADASAAEVDVRSLDGVLRISVRDDGRGGADFGRGSGLVGLRDRVEALGGRISIESPPGGGTSLQVELPLAAEPLVSG
jgi:signal transduction histidine kinase